MRVEIWSDVVCPWCYIGKRRFEAALSRFAHADGVEVLWRSFELDPTAPASTGQSLDELLVAKYGMDPAAARAANARVTALAAAEGLEYHLEAARPGNTFNAHRLIHLAAEHGLQAEMEEGLFAAYFTAGAAISDGPTLVRLAGAVGLDPARAGAVLASDAFGDAVRADEEEAGALGAQGVPFFVFDRTYGVSGAQPADTFLQVLERAWAEGSGGRQP